MKHNISNLPVFKGLKQRVVWLSEQIHILISQINALILIQNSVKTYKVLIDQNATDDPTVTVLKNTIGDIVWTRDGAGIYFGTLLGAFPNNKTTVLFTNGNNTYVPGELRICARRFDDDTILLMTTLSGVDVDDEISKATLLIEVSL